MQAKFGESGPLMPPGLTHQCADRKNPMPLCPRKSEQIFCFLW
jgi:hypothetical protein